MTILHNSSYLHMDNVLFLQSQSQITVLHLHVFQSVACSWQVDVPCNAFTLLFDVNFDIIEQSSPAS